MEAVGAAVGSCSFLFAGDFLLCLDTAPDRAVPVAADDGREAGARAAAAGDAPVRGWSDDTAEATVDAADWSKLVTYPEVGTVVVRDAGGAAGRCAVAAIDAGGKRADDTPCF